MISPRMLLASGVLALTALAQDGPLPEGKEDVAPAPPTPPVKVEASPEAKPLLLSHDRSHYREEKGWRREECLEREMTNRPWLGVNLERLDDAARAQLPNLPQGVGLAVESVVSGSPAELAGLQPYDVLWRWEDQWLINESQLRVLLRMRKPGEAVKFSVFRGGKDQIVTVTLAEPPAGKQMANLPPGVTWDPTMLDSPQPAMPIRVIDRGARSAKLETDKGTAELVMEEGGPVVTILRPDSTQLFKGPITRPEEFALVPPEWRMQVLALRRTLDRAIGEEMAPRKPRMRIIPNTSPSPQ